MNTSAAIPFLVIFIGKREKFLRQNILSIEDPTTNHGNLPKPTEVIVLGIFVVISFLATAFTDLFPSFLTTFLVEELEMTQQVGSNLTSAYFAMYALGNFLMIFGSIYVTITKIIILSYAGTTFVLTGIILSTIFPNEALLSALICLCGLFTSVMISTIYTWINEHVTPVTGKIASAMLVSGSLGLSLNPLLVGYLMESYTPMWLIYLSLSKTVLCILCFITVLILTNKCTKGKDENPGAASEEGNRNEIVEGKIDVYSNGKQQNVYECTHL